jgi:hypothetical protein
MGLALLAAALPAVSGCSGYKPYSVRAYESLSYKRPPEPPMNPPGADDEAMARRQWGQQEALYANSGIEAYANRFRYNYETSRNMNEYAGIVTGPLMFIGQSLFFPFTFIRAAPFEKETYRPFSAEPTFTGNPTRAPAAAIDANGNASPAGIPDQSPRLNPPTPAYPAGQPEVSPGAPSPGSPVNGGGSTGGGAGGK